MALNEQLPNDEPAERTAGKVTKNAKSSECQMWGAHSKAAARQGKRSPHTAVGQKDRGTRPCFSLKGGWRDSKGHKKGIRNYS